MSATIYDIARQAGVSIATVSRVFNNANNVSPKTRDKVLAIAQEAGYHPYAMAQGLARKKSKLITVIVPVISNHFFMEVLAGIQDKIADHDYDLNIYNVRISDDIDKQIEYLIKRGVADGYLLISIHLNDQQWSCIKKLHENIILIDEYHHEFDSVSVDSVEGAYLATKHLIDQGYERIAMITALVNSKPAQDRIRGYSRALQDAGRIVDNQLIVSGDHYSRDGFTERNGYEAMCQVLDMADVPDACFCSSDIQAMGALKAMIDRGVTIPIMGFDDLRFSEFLGLTSMKQPMYEMGWLALEKLLDKMEHPENAVSHTIFSPELVIRSSSESRVTA
ncbi:MAG: LacI family transcriptional regulator [Bacteroidetes bacterium HLUCCA01]|nr:MAG: LacI family transcriptional regulator [Bacteroidetes bacterium HLUCCA01]